MSTAQPNTDPREGLISSFALSIPSDLLPGDRAEALRVLLGEGDENTTREALRLATAACDGPPAYENGPPVRQGHALRIVADATEGDVEEIARDVSDSLTARDYFGSVRRIAEEIDSETRERIRKGEDPDDVRDWISDRVHEEADSSWWTTYTHANFRALLASSNWDAAADEGLADGLDLSEGLGRILAVFTYAAVAADVREHLDDPDDVSEEIDEEKDLAEEDVRDYFGTMDEEEAEALSTLRDDPTETDAAGLLLSRLADEGPGVEAVKVLLGLTDEDDLPAEVVKARDEARATEEEDSDR